MGFKSVMKKVGKVAKFAAPFALDFIPGGQLAHLALAGGLGAATTKGGVKSRLLGAGIGAGGQYAGHLLKGGGYNPVATGKDMTRAPMFGVGGGGNTGRSVVNSSVVPTPGAGNVPGGSVVQQVVGGAAKEPGIISKLLHDPKTYYAAMAAFQNPNPGDSKRAFKGIDVDADMRNYLAALGGDSARIQARLDNPNYYYNTAATNYTPGPVSIGASQIAGGLHTTPEEEQLRREQESRMGRG